MKKLLFLTLFLSTLFILQSCGKDRYPNVSTIEELIENGEVTFIEKKDSISGQPDITFINDSIYLLQIQSTDYIDSETHKLNEDEKKTDNYTGKTSFKLKNVFNGKTYISGTLDSGFRIYTNDKSEIMINNIVYSPPQYIPKKVDSSYFANKIKVSDKDTYDKLKELPEFDKSVIYKWTNTGRLGTIHEMFYYQLNDKKFKSTSECYLVSGKKNYFYNPKLGILQLK